MLMIIRVQCSSCWLVKNEKISRICSESEKILKIKSLVKEGLDIDDWVKVTDEKSPEKVAEFRDSVQPIISESTRIC